MEYILKAAAYGSPEMLAASTCTEFTPGRHTSAHSERRQEMSLVHGIFSQFYPSYPCTKI
jgi:hypothetical protein